MKQLLNYSAALMAFALLVSCAKPNEARLFKKTTTIMHTYVSITVVSDDAKKAESAIDAGFEEIGRLETLLSFWTDTSEIAAINKNAGIKPVKISNDTFEIIERALYVSDKTGGAFDPTIGPLIRLWDFKNKKRPDAKAVKEKLPLVDFKAMKLDKNNMTAFLNNTNMSFDTGGIAKGFAADKAAMKLRESGIKSALVAIGGDIIAFGTRPDGKPWRVGIRNPRSDNPADIIASIDLRDSAVSTSGDYERFFIEKNARYHHIINPKTGYPAMGCMSVTVIAPDATLTDGFSTGAFVLGPENGLKAIKENGLEGIIITTDGKTLVTEGIKNNLQWLDDNYKPN